MIPFETADLPRLATNLSADETLLARLADTAGKLATNLAAAALILVATLWLSGWASRLVSRAIGRVHRNGEPDATLQGFAASIARSIIVAVGLIAVLQQLGVQTTSILAVLTAASLAIGLALQGSLSNVAAGVMILLFRPYRVGDIIETTGHKGRVESLDLIMTTLATLDNLKVVVPNGKVFGDVIVNHSAHGQRRADVTFRLKWDIEPDPVLARLRERLAADPRVLKTPPPLVEAIGLTQDGFEVAARPWTALNDHSAVKSDMLHVVRLLAENPQAELPPLPKRPQARQTEPDPGRRSGRRRLLRPPKAE